MSGGCWPSQLNVRASRGLRGQEQTLSYHELLRSPIFYFTLEYLRRKLWRIMTLAPGLAGLTWLGHAKPANDRRQRPGHWPD